MVNFNPVPAIEPGRFRFPIQLGTTEILSAVLQNNVTEDLVEGKVKR
jgi:hypothetical protein